jgi:hypothetical protein
MSTTIRLMAPVMTADVARYLSTLLPPGCAKATEPQQVAYAQLPGHWSATSWRFTTVRAPLETIDCVVDRERERRRAL